MSVLTQLGYKITDRKDAGSLSIDARNLYEWMRGNCECPISIEELEKKSLLPKERVRAVVDMLRDKGAICVRKKGKHKIESYYPNEDWKDYSNAEINALLV